MKKLFFCAICTMTCLIINTTKHIHINKNKFLLKQFLISSVEFKKEQNKNCYTQIFSPLKMKKLIQQDKIDAINHSTLKKRTRIC